MRGKKKDSEFLSDFIVQCVNSGKNSPEDIVVEAKARINQIDMKIQEVERLKVSRSKLLDVIESFEKEEKVSASYEAKILSLFNIQYPIICKRICDHLKTSNILIKEINEFPTQDIVFCVKQLLELKIISKIGDCLLRGEMFDDYLKFVLREE